MSDYKECKSCGSKWNGDIAIFPTCQDASDMVINDGFDRAFNNDDEVCGGCIENGSAEHATWCPECKPDGSCTRHDAASIAPCQPPERQEGPVEAYQRGWDDAKEEAQKIIKRIDFVARGMCVGIGVCETTDKLASVYEFIRKDAEELTRILNETRGDGETL